MIDEKLQHTLCTKNSPYLYKIGDTELMKIFLTCLVISKLQKKVYLNVF